MKTSNFSLTSRRKFITGQEINIKTNYFLNETKVMEPAATKKILVLQKKTDLIAYSFTKHISVFIGDSLFQHPAELSKESPTIKLGDPCETPNECLAATNNSDCYGKVCVCQLGYSNFGGVCQPGKFCLRELH
jgi:hypothetical protein